GVSQGGCIGRHIHRATADVSKRGGGWRIDRRPWITAVPIVCGLVLRRVQDIISPDVTDGTSIARQRNALILVELQWHIEQSVSRPHYQLFNRLIRAANVRTELPWILLGLKCAGAIRQELIGAERISPGRIVCVDVEVCPSAIRLVKGGIEVVSQAQFQCY